MTTQHNAAEGAEPIVYQARLAISPGTVQLVTGLITRRRRQIRSRWRKTNPYQQAVIVLAVLRHDQRLADIAGGNQVSAATVRRWVWEVIDLLATRATGLNTVLARVRRDTDEGVVLLDGTLITTHRRTGTHDRRHYSGKHKRHGLLFLALTDLRGNLLWISAAQPGRTSEITAARRNALTTKLRHHDLGALCDLGFTGLEDNPDQPVIVMGRRAARARPISKAQKQANQLLARERAPGEHGFADLKNWRILTRLRHNPHRATHLLRALMILTNHEITR